MAMNARLYRKDPIRSVKGVAQKSHRWLDDLCIDLVKSADGSWDLKLILRHSYRFLGRLRKGVKMKDGPTMFMKTKGRENGFLEGPTILMKKSLLSSLEPTISMKGKVVRQ